jgi:S1-C subfamily serine protease
VAFALVGLLLVVAVVQAVALWNLRGDVRAVERQASADRAAAQQREQNLESRTQDLEQRTGNVLDGAAVAKDVLPSVFRVIAGQRAGTAFAFGTEAGGGGTNLLTNHHVVQEIYDSGGRDVILEQQNRRFAGQIVKVDPVADLALLVTTDKFPRLQSAAEAAKPGQPVVVVGAPFGRQDSVTSGVVSALRDSASGGELQFDAPVNPGNSGGPVVNAQKQVVGIVNAKRVDSEGISLGIPVAVVCVKFSLC